MLLRGHEKALRNGGLHAMPCLAPPSQSTPCLAPQRLAKPGPALPSLAVPGRALPCLATPGLASPRLASPCRAQPSPAMPRAISWGGIEPPYANQPFPCLASPCLALPGPAPPSQAKPRDIYSSSPFVTFHCVTTNRPNGPLQSGRKSPSPICFPAASMISRSIFVVMSCVFNSNSTTSFQS